MPYSAIKTSVPAFEMAQRLGDRIEALCRELLPGGEHSPGRRAWRVGSLAGEPGSALRVHLSGPRRGRWRDFKSDRGGDALDLVADVLFGGDKGRACHWGIGWLGLSAVEYDPQRKDADGAAIAAAHQRREAEGTREAAAQARDARGLWLAGQPLAAGDLAWRYLVGRGIALEELSSVPAALRLHIALWNTESRRHWPALLAAISAPDGTHINTHRIWLAERPHGAVGKAPLNKPKLSMRGSYGGGAVRLWKGASGKPWRAMPDGETVLVGEGIEDTLTVVCARPEWRAVAVLSVSSLASLVLPPRVARLIWLWQNDPPGSPAVRGLAKALQTHRDAGRRVAVLRPPIFLKDVNDYAMWLRQRDRAAKATR